MAAHDFLAKLSVRSQVVHCERLAADGAHLTSLRKREKRKEEKNSLRRRRGHHMYTRIKPTVACYNHVKGIEWNSSGQAS